MANSLVLSGQAQFIGPGAIINQLPLSATIAVAGNPYVDEVVSIGTSDTAVPLGNVTAPGVVVVKNLDSANPITVGVTSGTYQVLILAGDTQIFRVNGTAIHAIATGAAVLARFTVFSV